MSWLLCWLTLSAPATAPGSVQVSEIDPHRMPRIRGEVTKTLLERVVPYPYNGHRKHHQRSIRNRHVLSVISVCGGQ
jgi:hypothetical protein